MLRMASYPNLVATGMNVNKQLSPFHLQGFSHFDAMARLPVYTTSSPLHQDHCDIFPPVLELDLMQPDLSLASMQDQLASVRVF